MSGERERQFDFLRSSIPLGQISPRRAFSRSDIGFSALGVEKSLGVEDSPYDEAEKEAYNWPSLISIRRTSLKQVIEGDYLNIHLIGPGDDMFGWIDISGTKQGTFPDIKAIKWVELIGRIVTATILINESRRNA